MRLLNTQTFEFEVYSGKNIPTYAILSHTWGEEEVTLNDMLNHKASSMAGYSKITGCCSQAAEDGFHYVWIDTCCIDKSSSAELSEAINSMYMWYSHAHVCYVYVVDVQGDPPSQRMNDQFVSSKYFLRGWTLQELLAPSTVVFYSNDWSELGTKSSLRGLISASTGIEEQVLLGSNETEPCKAVKMYWASKRETTRVEDKAYCLMGIFGVNMPILYGEGEAAFLRLQEEIIRISDDETIFAWRSNWGGGSSGLLARSPQYFRESDCIRPHQYPWKAPYHMTNFGLRLVAHCSHDARSGLYTAILNCKTTHKPCRSVAVNLSLLSENGATGSQAKRFQRYASRSLVYGRLIDPGSKKPLPGLSEEIYVINKQPSKLLADWRYLTNVKFNLTAPYPSADLSRFYLVDKWPPRDWDPISLIDELDLNSSSLRLGTLTSMSYWKRVLRPLGLLFQDPTGEKFAVILNSHDSGVGLDISEDVSSRSLESICGSYYEDAKSFRRAHGYNIHQDRARLTLRSGRYAVKLSLKCQPTPYKWNLRKYNVEIEIIGLSKETKLVSSGPQMPKVG